MLYSHSPLTSSRGLVGPRLGPTALEAACEHGCRPKEVVGVFGVAVDGLPRDPGFLDHVAEASATEILGLQQFSGGLIALRDESSESGQPVRFRPCT